MGHRALVAYERTDNQYSLHYSHWGASELKLKHRITPETPFGGEDTDSDWAQELITELMGGLDGDAVDGYLADEQRPPSLVEPEPIVTGVSFDEIVADYLDYLHHEAFFVVDRTFEVTAYRTLWFGLQYECETVETGETVGNGALTTVRWYEGEPVGDGYLRGRFQALKDIVGDLINDGVFTEPEGRRYMKEKLAEWIDERQDLIIPADPTPPAADPDGT